MRIPAALLAFLCCASALAQDPLRIVLVADSADALVGQEVIAEAYRRIGVPVVFEAMSAAEALQQSNSGQAAAELQRIDGIDAVYQNLVQVPIPVNLIQGVAFSKKYRFPVTGWHSLRPYRIGIVKGIVFAEQNTRGMNVARFDSYENLIDAIDAGEVDVGVMPRIEGLEHIHKKRLDDVQEMEGVLETLFLYHYVHNSRADLVKLLEPTLKAMLLSGETRRERDRVLASLRENR